MPKQQRVSQQYGLYEAKPINPYNEPGFGATDPNQGNTGEPWGAQYASYGEPSPRGAMIQSALLWRIKNAAGKAIGQYSGFPQWNTVSYGIVTPMTYLRTTGPAPNQVSNIDNGPVTNMENYFG